MKQFYTIALLFVIILGSINQNVAQNLPTYGHADNEVLIFNHRYLYSFQSDTPQVTHKSHFLKKLGDNEGGFAVYSDKQGNLKLYSNGCHIWNGNHQPLNTTSNVLPDSLCQRFTVDDSLGGQSTINTAIPMPGNPDLIYVFSVKRYFNHAHLGKPIIYYSLVDISTDQIIISGQKFSDMPIKHDFAATKHTNGEDYWLVTRKYKENSYVAFRIRPGGNIDTVHSTNTGMPSSWDSNRYLKLSPDGRILGEIINLDTLQLFIAV